MRILWVAATLMLLVLAKACTTDDGITQEAPTSVASSDRVLVLCEGNFRRGNARVDAIYLDDNRVIENVLRADSPLELDVLQSAIVVQDSLLLLVANNSNELLLVSQTNLSVKRRYPGLRSPRYAVAISADEVLVSDLYAGAVLRLNLRTGTRVNLAAPRQTEGLVRHGDAVTVLAPSARKAYRYDISSGIFVDSIALGFPASVATEADNGQIAIAGGVVSAGDQGTLALLNWNERTVVNLLVLAQAESALYPRLLRDNNGALYCLQRALYRANLTGGIDTFELDNVQQPYALGLSNSGDEVLVGDAGSTFSGPGTVIRYSTSQFAELQRYEVGPLPSGFLFN